MTDRTSKNLSKFPKYGWKVKLDHEFPEKRDANLKPKLKQIIPLIPCGLRYFKWWAGKVSKKIEDKSDKIHKHSFKYYFICLS